MLLVGLTGGIGSGKSTVARLLVERGAVLVDADVVARQVVEPGTPGFEEIVERFGDEVVGDDGRLDRQRLADIVFADEQARTALNAITHPKVGEEMMRQVAEAPADAVVLMDVPLLAEGGRDRLGGYDCVLVVEAPPDVRLDRLEARGMSRDDAEARMARQASDAERREVADIVIDNSGDLESLERRVDEVWQELLARRVDKSARG